LESTKNFVDLSLVKGVAVWLRLLSARMINPLRADCA